MEKSCTLNRPSYAPHTSARIASHHLVTCAHNIPKHARAQRKLKSVDPSVKGKLKVS